MDGSLDRYSTAPIIAENFRCQELLVDATGNPLTIGQNQIKASATVLDGVKMTGDDKCPRVGSSPLELLGLFDLRQAKHYVLSLPPTADQFD